MRMILFFALIACLAIVLMLIQAQEHTKAGEKTRDAKSFLRKMVKCHTKINGKAKKMKEAKAKYESLRTENNMRQIAK